jgi:hypothetical protein
MGPLDIAAAECGGHPDAAGTSLASVFGVFEEGEC